MIKLFAAAAIAVGLLAAGSPVHAADNDAYFGCGAPPTFDDPTLLAELERKKAKLIEWASTSPSEIKDRIDAVKALMIYKYSTDVEHVVDRKIHHMACVLQKDPDNGLRSVERARLGVLNGGPEPVDDQTFKGLSRCNIDAQPTSSCQYHPATRLETLAKE